MIFFVKIDYFGYLGDWFLIVIFLVLSIGRIKGI